MLKKVMHFAREWLTQSRAKKNFNSRTYWQNRYDQGMTSGEGSYGVLALFKAEVLNQFVQEHSIQSVIEFGCGDGNQLSYAHYPHYRGFDVSASAVEMCRQKFARDETKSFALMENYQNQTAELSISLDVLYHLVEDQVFHEYMEKLFLASDRYVIIYSANMAQKAQAPHEYYRVFTDWVEKYASSWKLIKHLPNKYADPTGGSPTSFAEFYFYEKK